MYHGRYNSWFVLDLDSHTPITRLLDALSAIDSSSLLHYLLLIISIQKIFKKFFKNINNTLFAFFERAYHLSIITNNYIDDFGFQCIADA